MSHVRSIVTLLLIAAVVICIAETDSTAATGGNFGVRGGYDFDAEQVVVGAQAELGKFMQSLRFAPSADFTFGENVKTVALNADFRIYLVPPGSGTTFYGGAGPTLLIIDPDNGDSDSELGLTLSGGIKFGGGKGHNYNLEGRFGLDEMPDFRLLFGILF
jgi:hypothetical protein